MNYEQKYLKYKAKYIELKAKLDGGLFGDAKSSVNDSDKKKTQRVIEKLNIEIKELERAIKGRQNNILDSEKRKKGAIENKLKAKNNDEAKEIDEAIIMWDSRIKDVQKEIDKKNKERGKKKKLLEKATTKLK